jgi:hypothetical protein
MIELKSNELLFSFPEVHPQARLAINLQRTLRIPDDGRTYPLPPGLGPFPLRHVDDHAGRVPAAWLEHGGVMCPMYQAEALWLHFVSHHLTAHRTSYPFAIKVAAGKIDAVSGKPWSPGLHRSPQDYMVSPRQPWLDGYHVAKGYIRQFVAMPLGAGYTAEEQLTHEAEHGGLQVAVYPMKRESFERRFPPGSVRGADRAFRGFGFLRKRKRAAVGFDMGLAPGGKMRQTIYADPFGLEDWDLDHPGRCFIHLANSLVWQAITGRRPPTKPPTAERYAKAGLPWFDYYDEAGVPLDGSPALAELQGVAALGRQKGEAPLPENTSVTPGVVVPIHAGWKQGRVREGTF